MRTCRQLFEGLSISRKIAAEIGGQSFRRASLGAIHRLAASLGAIHLLEMFQSASPAQVLYQPVH
jgi:hypothetical protein